MLILDAEQIDGSKRISKTIDYFVEQASAYVEINKKTNSLKIQAIETKKIQLLQSERMKMNEALEKFQSEYSNNYLKQFKIADDRYEIFFDLGANADLILKSLEKK
jgi:hypothetical protein